MPTTSTSTALDAILGAGVPVVSVAPVDLDAPDRPLPLQVRVSAPVTGSDLPVLLFSHGNGQHLDAYGPLVSSWASYGFVVVQPTHLDSRRNGFGFDHPVFPSIWRERTTDLVRVLDQLDTVEAALPGLAGRVDHTRVAAVGHSWGAQSVQALLGARVLDDQGRPGEDRRDTRVTAGVLLAATGVAGDELVPFAAENFPFMRPSFAELTTRTLVVAGDRDQSAMSTRGPDWFTDAFTSSPGATDLLTLHGGEHGLGGISGYEAAETTDEDPARVALVQRLTTAYLRSALDPEDDAWERARASLPTTPDAPASVTGR